MKIAIIGWGSLIWDPRDLPREGTWQGDGPELQIEFSRISRDARLTLVIDFTHGSPVKTMHVQSPRASLEDARNDLRKREGITSDKKIGWVDVIHDTDSRRNATGQADVHTTIRNWCGEKGYGGAVWTALESNFEKETGIKFSADAAVSYLKRLPKNVQKEARKYIHNAPDCVVTQVRQKEKEEFGGQLGGG
jgi:hypothetical protein